MIPRVSDFCYFFAHFENQTGKREEFYLIDTKIEQAATGLGLTAIGLDRPIEQMSGGQRAG